MTLTPEEKQKRKEERKLKRDAAKAESAGVTAASPIVELIDLVKGIDQRLQKLENKNETASEVFAKIEKKEVAPITEQPKQPEYPIPLEYRQIVDSVLNSNFNIRCIPSKDSPTFEFGILVPREYSNAPVPHWDTYKEDYRPKSITYAEGVTGVKMWVDKVYDNFSNEIKAKIVADRANLTKY